MYPKVKNVVRLSAWKISANCPGSLWNCVYYRPRNTSGRSTLHQTEERRGLAGVLLTDEIKSALGFVSAQIFFQSGQSVWGGRGFGTWLCESALLSGAPCWGLRRTGGHKEHGASHYQIPLKHIPAQSQHTHTHTHVSFKVLKNQQQTFWPAWKTLMSSISAIPAGAACRC